MSPNTCMAAYQISICRSISPYPSTHLLYLYQQAACSSGTPGFWGQYRPNAGTNRPFLSLPKLESQQKPVKASTDIALPGMGGGDSGLGGGGDGTGGKVEGAGWNEDDGEEYLNLAQVGPAWLCVTGSDGVA